MDINYGDLSPFPPPHIFLYYTAKMLRAYKNKYIALKKSVDKSSWTLPSQICEVCLTTFARVPNLRNFASQTQKPLTTSPCIASLILIMKLYFR